MLVGLACSSALSRGSSRFGRCQAWHCVPLSLLPSCHMFLVGVCYVLGTHGVQLLYAYYILLVYCYAYYLQVRVRCCVSWLWYRVPDAVGVVCTVCFIVRYSVVGAVLLVRV